jgi:lipopolysaccharide/colanic/teichoic acid biosynthesis glycosyltransferase
MRAGRRRRIMLGCKRALDLTTAALLLIVTGPIMIAIAIAIMIASPGPPLFVQTRAGRHGRPFRIFKFRTMVPDADRGGPVLSMEDSRITRVGRFLRRTSLDELPQLFNVLKGDMSLVGPRPQLLETTRAGEERRFEMRPGITGLTAVSRFHLLSWDERMRLDIEYVDRWSFGLDLRILLRTIPQVFVRKDVLGLPRGTADDSSTGGLP